MINKKELAGVTAPLEEATSLPPACYTNPGVFEQETAKIFYKEWICIARSDQIPAVGDFVCFDLVNQPLVIVRNKDGQIHAMSSVCLHRAMPVATGAGNATSFSCPYHLWKYDLEGRLVSAPMMDGLKGFEPRECRLPPVRVEEWGGFVFVCLDPDARPLAPRLEGLDKVVSNYALSELVVGATTDFDSPWNWKLLVENFMEAYHHIGAHRDTLQPIYPAKDSHVSAADDHLWSALYMPGISEDDTPTPLPRFPELNRTEQHALLACVVSPTLLFAANSNSVFWYQLEPRAHDRMNLKIHILVRAETAADEKYAEAIANMCELARYVHIEDIAVNEGPWRGLHAPLATTGRLSRLEKAIWHTNQFWVERMTRS